MAAQALYSAVLHITEDYLGPAAPRFLNRLSTSHLQKQADQLNRQDLPELIDWIKLAVMVITEDEKLAKEYVERLEALL